MGSEHALCKQGLIRRKTKQNKQPKRQNSQQACCGDLVCLFNVHTYCTYITNLCEKYSHCQPQCTARAPRLQLNVWWDSLKTHSLKIFRYSNSSKTSVFILLLHCKLSSRDQYPLGWIPPAARFFKIYKLNYGLLVRLKESRRATRNLTVF